MTERAKQIGNSETPQTAEILMVRFSGLTISGRSGTGKTVTAEKLADLYSIPRKRFYKTGQLIREVTESGQKSQGFMEREEYVDKELDRRQRVLIETSSPNDPLMLEGRLAGVIASEEKQKNPQIKVVSFLFVAPSQVRTRRILKRHLKDNEEFMQQLREQLSNAYSSNAPAEEVIPLLEHLSYLEKRTNLSLKIVKFQEKEREQKDLARWRKLYPQLRGIDPFNPANKDARGRRIYDFIIKTGNLSIEEIVDEINSILIKNGLAEKTTEESLPQSGVIFSA